MKNNSKLLIHTRPNQPQDDSAVINSAGTYRILNAVAAAVATAAIALCPLSAQSQGGSIEAEQSQQKRIEYDNAGLDDNFGLSREQRETLLRCPQDTIPVPVLPSDDGRPLTEYPIELEADEMGTDDGNTVVLSGDAEVVQGNQAIKADKLVYRKEEDRLDAVGEVVVYTPFGDRIEADRMDIELETFIGEADNPRFRIAERDSIRDQSLLGDSGSSAPTLRELLAIDAGSETTFREDQANKTDEKPGESTVRARGSAKKVYFEGHDLMRLETVEYTTCLEGHDDVVISATEVELDKADNVGIARNVKLKFMDVPIFYFPYLSFPITSERKTGFLFPGFGRQDDAGVVLEAPWYWNIAPNVDATFVPRYYERRGTQLAAEVRYLTESSTGSVRAEVLPNDKLIVDPDVDSDRSAFSFRHEQLFSDRLTGRIEYEDASDAFYYDDFDTDVEITSSTHLPRLADLSYFGDFWQFSGRFTEYKTLDDDIDVIDRPYQRLPQLNANGTIPLLDDLLELGLLGEWTNFQRDSGLTGTRLDLTPSISLPYRQVYGFVVPKLAYRFTNYSLEDLADSQFDDDSPSRAVPVLSVDSGLYFDRDTTWRGKDHVQTLEPRLFYTYIPFEDQRDLPNFDTSELSFDVFSDLFRENRFQGADRVGDTSQLTVALTSRLLNDATGLESLSASIGQILFMKDREVDLDTTPISDADGTTEDEDGDQVVENLPDTRSTSDLLASLDAQFNDEWSVGSFIRYDTDESEVGFGTIDLEYERNARQRLQFGYLYSGENTEQLDLRVAWPISSRWDFRARERYDLDRNVHQETTVSLGYDACCWGIDFTYQRRVSRREDEYKNSFFVVFELTGLGRIRSGF